MTITLNNRHKAGLFFTTVVAGLCLILGETFRETIGAIIIGFALTWAFGSTSRSLRISIGALGTLILVVPLFAALIDHHDALQKYEKSLRSFRSKLPDFAKAHPDLATGLRLPPGATLNLEPSTTDDPYACYGEPIASNASQTLEIPNVGKIAFPCSASDRDIAKAIRANQNKNPAPSWYLEALDAGISPGWIVELTPPLEKPDTFDLKHTLSDGALIEIPSAILAILFFGSVIAEAKKFTSRSNKIVES
jgi:hypothetical protein